MDKRDTDPGRKILRFGTGIIVCALVFRLGANGFFSPVTDLLKNTQVMSFLLYLQTGRLFRQQPESPEDLLPTGQQETEGKGPALPDFLPEAAELLDIRYNCDYRPDMGLLLDRPLIWDLQKEKPSVLILHTHATESYTPSPGENYTEDGSYRTLDENYNMLSVGKHLAQRLEAAGIGVIHDKTLHDYPSYSGSYAASRVTVENWLEKHPSICLVLDLHRDAAEDSSGNQIAHTVDIAGEQAAKFMLVLGSDAGGLEYPNWQENLALGLKLQHTLEQLAPGSCRSMNFCGQRYNQDLSSGMLLIEMGGAGNTHSQALRSAELLADAILYLAKGSQ